MAIKTTSMEDLAQQMKSAVLFLTYRRFGTAEKVFESIREAKPPRLYFASNAPNPENKNEEQRVDKVRGLLDRIDWNCEVHTLFRDEHLSVKYSIPSAIDWFFENEETGIILEDDCLPSQSFYPFCDELLDRYKDDMRVGQISGDNFQNGIKRGDADYYFSIYNHIWGWASWANRWQNYDVNLKNFNDTKFIKDLFDDKKTVKCWLQTFKIMKKQLINTWDYQWTFTLWNKKQLTILPNTNLIENVGFGVDATHTTGESELANLKAYELELKNHPKEVKRDLEADKFTSKMIFEKKTLFERVVNKLRELIR